MMNHELIKLNTVNKPITFKNVAPVPLTDETINERKHKVIENMKKEEFDSLIIYADKEHGGNFEYLTGFVPRFEEALLILNSNGDSFVVLGNENLKMAKFSRIPVELIHCPYFSLPNQPMDNEKTLDEIFQSTKLNLKRKIGIVGWKMFTSKISKNQQLFDLPYFIIDALKNILNENSTLENAAHLFIGGLNGARTTNNANEIAHYEYGANLSSTRILEAMDAIEVGIQENELGALLNGDGQYNSVVTIAATGTRFENANFYPTYKKVVKGDPLSLTIGFKGGLSSRTGFVVSDETELPSSQSDYLDRVAKPYFFAVSEWLKNIKIGMKGSEIYETIETSFPKEKYGWHLNPGHLVADEEWMSSPIFKNSQETLKSGMLLQIDIIPSILGYTGVSAEECIALADTDLQDVIKEQYPSLWSRVQTRRNYLIDVLGINLSDHVLPLSNTVAYLRPFYLAKCMAFHFD